MARYFIHFSGHARDEVGVELDDVDQARNRAVSELGALLTRDPDYASNAHWRVDVEDEHRSPLLHVVIATITARRIAKIELSAQQKIANLKRTNYA